MAPYIKKADRVTQTETPSPDFGALLNDPRFAALLEAAVKQRMAETAVSALASNGMSPEFAAFLDRMEKAVGARDEQRPGYQKPLTAEQLESRRQGYDDMLTLMRAAKSRAQAGGEWPRYLLKAPFQGPSMAGPVVYPSGQEINWLGAPGETFQPLNEPAAEIYVAYKKWVGVSVDMKALLAQAIAEARGGVAIPENPIVRSGADNIQIVDAPLRDLTPKRILGTSGIETSGSQSPRQVGPDAGPQGPVFVTEAA